MRNWTILPFAAVVALTIAGTPIAQGAPFHDDFNTFDTANWTHYGSGNIDVDATYPDAMYVHGARDWSPAARMTHVMPTGENSDFQVQFDYRVHNYSGNGRVYIGWLNINDFVSVQRHDSSYQVTNDWWSHDSQGNPASGLFMTISCSQPGNVALYASNDGASVATDGFAAGHNNPLMKWYTVRFGRTAATGWLEVLDRDTQNLVGRCQIGLPNQRNYDYFHFSTMDNMANNWWADFEIDNLQLTPEPASLTLLTLGGLLVLRRRW